MDNMLILGSGLSGIGACKLAIKKKLNIRVSDSNKILKKNKVLFEKLNISWEENQHSFSNLDWADCIIKSPGISNSLLIVICLIGILERRITYKRHCL